MLVINSPINTCYFMGQRWTFFLFTFNLKHHIVIISYLFGNAKQVRLIVLLYVAAMSGTFDQCNYLREVKFKKAKNGSYLTKLSAILTMRLYLVAIIKR